MNTFLWPLHSPQTEPESVAESRSRRLARSLDAGQRLLGVPSARLKAPAAPPCEGALPEELPTLSPAELSDRLKGQLVELSGEGGGAGLTLAAALVREAQACGEPTLWLSSRRRPVYPPDLVEAGVMLERLPFLFLEQPTAAQKAALRVLSCGGLGLLVWDSVSWSQSEAEIPTAVLGRLKAAARHHRACALLLSEKSALDPSAGPLVGVRLQVESVGGCWDLLEVCVVKDKRGLFGGGAGGGSGGGRRWRWRCRLPDGLPASTALPAPAAPTPAA